MKKRKGISLIVLIITIIVVIILAAAVILTLSKNNPIESAKEARFKEDVRTFQDELSLAISKQYTNVSGQRDEKITTSNFDEIKEYIPSFNNKYRSKFVIENDEFKYTSKATQNEIKWLNSLNISKTLLVIPNEYQQVEYIESTGIQYIDTEYVFKNTPKIICEFMLMSDMDLDIMGNSGMSDGCFIIDFSGQQLHYRYSSASKQTVNTGIKLYEWNTFEFSDKVKVNDKEILSVLEYNFLNNSQSFLIGKGRSCGYARFKEIKMYDGDELVRDLIPCYFKENLKAGMYDIVNDKFYTDKLGNNFYIPFKKIKLPTEDSELEYIESTGTQYINTGYIFKNKPKIVGEIMLMSALDRDIMGTSSANNGCFIMDFLVSNLYYRYSTPSYKIINTGIKLYEWNTFEFSDKVKVNDKEILSVLEYNFLNNNQSFLIGKGRSYGYARFKEIKMYDGDELVRDLIPYYKKEENKVGMYDKVNNVFYSNQGNQEDFIAGPKI